MTTVTVTAAQFGTLASGSMNMLAEQGAVLYKVSALDTSKVEKILLMDRAILFVFLAVGDQPLVTSLLARFSSATAVSEIV